MLKKSWIRFVSRLKLTPDREAEQAVVRFGLTIVLSLYSGYMYFFVLDDRIMGILFGVALGYMAFAVSVMLIIAWKPIGYPGRRVYTMVCDVAVIAFSMWVGDERTSMLYVIFLWLSLGNGLRFGISLLYLASTLSTLGFAIVIVTNDFWLNQPILSVGLLVGLLGTTLYVAMLLRRIEEEKQLSEASNQAKSRFLANMSHEIRTPLNGVVGMTDLLAGTPMGVEQREIMSSIQASAETLLNLIEGVLDFSKIEAGKVEVKPSDQDISELVNLVVSMMKPAADAKSLELRSWIDLDVSPVVRTDPQLLRQILINLLNNAIKFTEVGSVMLKVTPYRSEMDPDDTRRLLFEVIDTGVGIPEGQLDLIFERFKQVDDSTTRQYGGSGLGTTITKQLVELMLGTIGVESRVGEGSRFWFQIPAPPGDLSLNEQHLMDARVLLFADLLSERQEVLDALQEWPVDIMVCNTVGDGFLELLNAAKMGQAYDIAIVDETQDVISGDELLQVIRAEKSLDTLGLVCVTRHAPSREREQELCLAGFNAVVTYPVTKEKIRHVLQYALKGGNGETFQKPPRIFRSADQTSGGRARILLAEDNRINQKVVKKILELQGHDVTVVDDGTQALKALENRHFDLAILDLHMPDVGGVDVIRTHRETLTGQDSIPFMILTANATAEAVRQCEAAGVNAYLTKPVRSAHLLDEVNKLLGGDIPGIDTDTLIDEPTRPASMEKSSRVLDRETLRGLEGLSRDPGFLHNLINSFLRDSETLLVSMRDALESVNSRQFRDSAHLLADNASGIGAYALMAASSAASRVEEEDFAEQGGKLLTRVASNYNMTCQALDRYLKTTAV
ncbi:MAG: ATP-binding protein [Candidatus Thiodiazotropha sp.]